MTDAATAPALAPDDAVHQTVELGQALIRAVYGYDISAAMALDALLLDPEVVQSTAGVLFKQREDVAALSGELITEALAPEAA